MPRSIRRRSIRPFSSAVAFFSGRSLRPSISLGPLSLSLSLPGISSVVYNSGSQAHVGRVSGVRHLLCIARVREERGRENERREGERPTNADVSPLPRPAACLTRFPIPSAVSSHLPPLRPSDSFLSVLPLLPV